MYSNDGLSRMPRFFEVCQSGPFLRYSIFLRKAAMNLQSKSYFLIRNFHSLSIHPALISYYAIHLTKRLFITRSLQRFHRISFIRANSSLICKDVTENSPPRPVKALFSQVGRSFNIPITDAFPARSIHRVLYKGQHLRFKTFLLLRTIHNNIYYQNIFIYSLVWSWVLIIIYLILGCTYSMVLRFLLRGILHLHVCYGPWRAVVFHYPPCS